MAPVETPRPLISVRRADSSVTLPREGKRVTLDLGAYLVAGDLPFEVRITRPAERPYRSPISATILRPDSAGGDVTVPSELLGHFGGLPKFASIRLRDEAGTLVFDRTVRFCGSSVTARVRPDAPDASPYPMGCRSYNPFTLGSVHGVQSGWAMPVADKWRLGARLAEGAYTATVSITRKFRELLGLPWRSSRTTIQVQVVPGEGCEHCLAPSSPRFERSPSPPNSAVPTAPAPREPVVAAQVEPQDVPAEALPDLRSVPAWAIRVSDDHFLNFAATVWNAGPSPLVVDGFRRDGEAVMDAFQYFYDTEGVSHGYLPTGTMKWDSRDGHRHWHFTDFARYRLLNANKSAVVRSSKEAFCLANTDVIDYTVPGANWRPENTDLRTACGEHSSLAVREVLDVGSGDTYFQDLPGQSFDLTGLPPGRYFIEVSANPAGRLVESKRGNNTALRKVRIGGAANSEIRTVKVFDVGLVKAP
jgi:hypothetical protein